MSQRPAAWRVPIAGVFEFFRDFVTAARERAKYEADCGDDAEHCEPEPLFTALPWIPVSEKPIPEDDKPVLVYLERPKYGTRMAVAIYTPTVKYINGRFIDCMPAPTHWRPLPEGPEEAFSPA